MCLPDDNYLGAAGCVASTMMMYAHTCHGFRVGVSQLKQRGKGEKGNRGQDGGRGTGKQRGKKG